MEIVQPTFSRAVKVWWAITWRALSYGIGFGVVASLLIGAIVPILGGGETEVSTLTRVASFVLGFAGSLYASFSQLGRKCGDVKLVLVRA